MPFPLLLSSILRETWAIEPRFAQSFDLLIQSLASGHELEYQGELPKISASSPSGESFPDYDQAPKGSIGIIPVHGAMMKYDTLCSWGTQTLAAHIRHAADHKNLSGIIMDIDSGGGAMNALPPILEAIAYARERMPVVAFCDVAASAAYYTAVHCDRVILSNDISAQVGSIGVMMSFTDMKPYYEAQGVKFHTVYATESPDKNKAFELALKGEYELIKQELLSPAAVMFQEAVRTNRPGLDTSVPGILSGKMFMARDAIKCGMVDAIGTFAQALDVAATLTRKSKSTKYSPSNKTKMDNSKITSLLAILGYASLAGQDGQVCLSLEEIARIQKAYKAKHHRSLDLKGLTFDEGYTSLSEESLQEIEAAYNKEPVVATQPLKPNPETRQLFAEIQGLKETVQQLKTEVVEIASVKTDLHAILKNPDVITYQNDPTAQQQGRHPDYVMGTGYSWDKADITRPWNMKALGKPVVEGASSIDLDTVISDLGNYSRQRRDEIISFMREHNQVNQIFPFISGINDEVVFNNLFLGEFTQAFQNGWTPKGSFKIEPEIVKMFRIKIDHDFEDLKVIELTWLSDLNKEGSNAYKMSFVGFLIREMLKKAAREDAQAAINGVFQAPVPGVPGKYLSKMDGLRKYLRTKVEERKIIPFQIGEWDETNILDWERGMVEMIPEEWRDQPGLGFYASTRYMEVRYNRKKQLEGGNTVYEPHKSTIDNHENIRLIAVPDMGDSKRVFITPVGNIRQLEFVPSEQTFLESEKSKRVFSVFCDYKRGIQALAVGKKWALSETPDYLHQMIWMNDVDIPSSTFISMKADDTTPSVKEHKSLVSVNNTAATAITDILDAQVGDVVILKCGSAMNPVTIAKAGNFANITANWEPEVGDTIRLQKRGAGDWIELKRTSSTTAAIPFTADDTTPSVAGGTTFITVANSQATAITDLDDAVADTYYTIYGGSSTNASTIANAGKFSLTAAMTLSLGKMIVLYAKDDGTFIETERQ
jgi:signal peptide peptidase SppA